MCHCSKRCQISCLISLSSLVVYTVDLPPRFVGPLTAAILLALDWGVKVKVVQLCPALWDPKDHSLSSSSVHGILQARILEWIAIPFSRESSRPGDWTQVAWTAGRFFTIWATREAPSMTTCLLKIYCPFLLGCFIISNTIPMYTGY